MYAASGLLSAPFSVFWIAALALVFAFHCRHLAQGCRECRWFHASHLAMAVGMLYMFGVSAFGWNFVSQPVWSAFYVAIAAAIVALFAYQIFRRGSLDPLWLLALIQQAAMIYMWAPMSFWRPWVSYGLAVYFALEAIAWPLGLCSEQSLARVGAAFAGGGAVAAAGFDRRSTLAENLCMTVMAASMGYMFVGMQFLMPTPMAPVSPAIVEMEEPATAPRASGEAPKTDVRSSWTSTETLAPAAAAQEARSYRIVTGDTLERIALRLYGDGGRWRDLGKANPGLDPRRLKTGATIMLPEPASATPKPGR